MFLDSILFRKWKPCTICQYITCLCLHIHTDCSMYIYLLILKSFCLWGHYYSSSDSPGSLRILITVRKFGLWFFFLMCFLWFYFRSSDSSPSSVRSPITKKKKHKDIESRKIKKENNEYYRNQKTSHKRKKQISSSLSRSQSQSPERMYKSSHKKYYKEKERYDYKDEKRYNDYKDRYDYKEKDHYEYSPDYRYTKRHRNGHRSSSPERYDRYLR